MLSKRVTDLKGDTKALYKLTCNLTGHSTTNPMPPGKTDSELANEFAEYFLEKIEKIRDLFNGKPTYTSEQSDVPRFRRFSPLTESEVKNACTIMAMQSKSCELDAMPTQLFKRLTDKTKPIVTKAKQRHPVVYGKKGNHSGDTSRPVGKVSN